MYVVKRDREMNRRTDEQIVGGQEGGKEERKKGRKEERKKGRKEERKKGRKEERKKGRNIGRQANDIQ